MTFLKGKEIYFPLVVVLILGAALRLYAFYFSHLMFNSDGIYYLQQAKALYLGEFDRFLACYWEANIYPFLIIPFYWLTGHWVVAAKSVSFVFGTATLIPLYVLLRHFFDRKMATCVLAFAAFNPFLVKYSSDALRGPVCWFFSCLGLMLFVSAWSREKRGLWLAASCLAYFFAAWARIEAVALLFISPVFLLFLGESGRRVKDVLAYVSPFILAGVGGFCVIVFGNVQVPASLLPREIVAALQYSFENYNQVRDGLQVLGRLPATEGISPGFFKQCRNLIPWISLGDVLGLFIIMASHQYIPFFLFGFKDVGRKLVQDVKLRYLLTMGVACLLVVIFHEVRYWIMSARFVALIFFCLLVFFGYGLQRFLHFISQRRQWSQDTILVSVVCCLFLVSAPQNLKHYRVDKLVFREMGEYIAGVEDGSSVVAVGAFFKRVSYVNLFANLDVPTSPCCNDQLLAPRLHGEPLVNALRYRGVSHFLWDEKNCDASELTLLKEAGFLEVTVWQTKRLGRVVLLRAPADFPKSEI